MQLATPEDDVVYMYTVFDPASPLATDWLVYTSERDNQRENWHYDHNFPKKQKQAIIGLNAHEPICQILPLEPLTLSK